MRCHQPGLVSVTFQQRTCADVIRYAQAAQLKVIEWHGYDHVPHGDMDAAFRVGQSTLDANLAVAAYGSYYVLGESESLGLPFDTVLQTAKALRAPMVRVWAGRQSPDKASPRFRSHISDQARRIADLAAQEGIQVVLEFHNGTLTQTGESCAALMESMDHSNVGAYWQPAPEMNVSQNLAQLRQVLPWLVGLHVFHWGPTDMDRHPLAEGELEWAQYLAIAGQCHSPLNVMLEFVSGDTVEQFREDAATLHELLAQGVLHDGL